MKDTPRDYSKMTAITKSLGLVPYTDRLGRVIEGSYTLEGKHAPIDLSACAEDEISILKTALKQLSETVNDYHHDNIERDLLS